MRIDYSEPRKSYISSPKPIKLSSPGSSSGSTMAITATVIGILIFIGGFSTGWYLSQKSAKKAFRAAMEQQSLENSPKEEKKPVVQPQQPIGAPVTGATATTTSAQPAAGQTGTQTGTAQATGPNGQPLSFFENLPKGQKNTVLGSGINDKTKPAPMPGQTASTQHQQPSQPTGRPPEPPAVVATPAAKTAPHTAGYVVQVASYRSQDDAKKLKKELNDKGYSDIFVSEINLNENGTWFRVRIGRHLEKEAATKIANKLLSSAKVLPDSD